MTEKINHGQFPGYDQLPTSLLEEIIQADFNGNADLDDEVIAYILEILEQRKQTEDPQSVPDVQAAWQSLQARVDAKAECDPLPKIQTRQKLGKPNSGAKRVLRRVAVIAACFAVLMAAMITAQAVGLDIFGALARWTDNKFQFAPIAQDDMIPSEPSECVINTEFQQLLTEAGLPVELAPMRIPEGYRSTEVQIFEMEALKYAYIVYQDDAGNDLLISLEEYYDSELFNAFRHEKDPGSPEIYMKGDMAFYLFTNSGKWTAIWSSGNLMLTIEGMRSKESTIAVVESIGEIVNE